MMVAKGVWFYMARLASEADKRQDWILRSWIAKEGHKHPQIEFQARGVELWARWLVGVSEGRRYGGRAA
jgi:hypothetical protein